MTKPFKVAVMGAGAVGCYYGGMLARAGHEVVLIARPQHVEAIARDGLRMQTKTFDEQAAVGEAMNLFWEKGYRATTPAELGEALGIGRGSLYHAFGSKHALYRRALEQYVADQRQQPVRELLLPEP